MTFLTAVICNEPLSKIAALADYRNGKSLMMWHRLLFNIFPSASWGSKENMQDWMHNRGTNGTPLFTLESYVNSLT